MTGQLGVPTGTPRWASCGAFVVLQHAVDHPGEPRAVVSSGMAAALAGGVDQQLAAFEPVELRARVTSSCGQPSGRSD